MENHMKRKKPSQSAFFSWHALIVLLCGAAACTVLAGTLPSSVPSHAPGRASHPTTVALSFAERVAYQRAIEEVYWRHRIWPKDNSNPKPSLDAVTSQAELEKKVRDYLRNSQALEDYWQEPMTAEQLQAEMDRMAQNTRQPEVLRELFEALGNDPFVIAECLAKPVLAQHVLTELNNEDHVRKVAAIDSIAEAVRVNRPYLRKKGATSVFRWRACRLQCALRFRSRHGCLYRRDSR
jgi:hypothetical protein